MTPTGLEKTSTESLLKIRDNLLAGLGKVVKMSDEELYHQESEGAVTPLLAGQVSYMLLSTVDRECVNRGMESVL